MSSISLPALKHVLHELADRVVGAQDLHQHIDRLDQVELEPAAAPEPPPEGFEEVPGQPGIYRRTQA